MRLPQRFSKLGEVMFRSKYKSMYELEFERNSNLVAELKVAQDKYERLAKRYNRRMMQEITRTVDVFSDMIEYLIDHFGINCEFDFEYEGEIEGDELWEVRNTETGKVRQMHICWEPTHNGRLSFDIAISEEQ